MEVIDGCPVRRCLRNGGGRVLSRLPGRSSLQTFVTSAENFSKESSCSLSRLPRNVLGDVDDDVLVAISFCTAVEFELTTPSS